MKGSYWAANRYRNKRRGRIRGVRSRTGTIFIFVILLLACAFSAMPLIYSVAQSLKPLEELYAFPPRFLVVNPTMENYEKLFQLTDSLWVPFSRYLFNSLFVAVVGTVVYVIIAAMAAYALAVGSFPGAKLLNHIIVKALLFSSPVLMVSQYLILSRTGMLNTYRAMLLPALAAPLGLFLMRQFILQMIPVSILEAARMDGAGTFRTFFCVVMPMVKPAWLTLSIFTFQSLWAGAGAAYIYKEEYKVLPTVLNQIAAGGTARAGVAAAASVILIIPPVLFFLLVQSRVIETMSASGIKE